MAQGAVKGLKGKSKATSSNSKKDKVKKGRRYKPPKKNLAEVAMRKSLSAEINKSIEKQMVAAASGGKLTIMRPTASTSSKAPSKAAKSS